MNSTDNSASAWGRLVRLAGRADEETPVMPLGFSTRVIAHWKAQPQEASWAMMEWFTWRALAVAALLVLGSAALGFEGLSSVLANETAQAGSFIDDLMQP